ncbi:MAG: hypothetical protein ABR606_05040 [Vicinamibacterales bacterium]
MIKALMDGRAATKQKYAVASVLDDLTRGTNDEPVRLAQKLVTQPERWRPPYRPRSLRTGENQGVPVPGYVEEDGVRAERRTETYAQATLTFDNWRWAGVPFVLGSGKALAGNRRSIAVYFKPVPHLAFLQDQSVPPNVLALELQPDRVSLQVNVNGVGDRPRPRHNCTGAHARRTGAIGVRPLDVLNGDASLSIRNDEVEESWRIVTPILNAWAENKVPPIDYPAGSNGPRPASVG